MQGATSYLGRDVRGSAALYRNEIADPAQASAVARAGALLRRTMQASEDLSHQFDSLASGQSLISSSSKLKKPPLAAVPANKAVTTLEAELELVNKRLAHLRKAQAPQATGSDCR